MSANSSCRGEGGDSGPRLERGSPELQRAASGPKGPPAALSRGWFNLGEHPRCVWWLI